MKIKKQVVNTLHVNGREIKNQYLKGVLITVIILAVVLLILAAAAIFIPLVFGALLLFGILTAGMFIFHPILRALGFQGFWSKNNNNGKLSLSLTTKDALKRRNST